MCRYGGTLPPWLAMRITVADDDSTARFEQKRARDADLLNDTPGFQPNEFGQLREAFFSALGVPESLLFGQWSQNRSHLAHDQPQAGACDILVHDVERGTGYTPEQDGPAEPPTGVPE